MSKYRNKKVEIDGLKFDSQKEGRRYLELKNLSRGGYIQGLECQPKFWFEIEGHRLAIGGRVVSYTADFKYYEAGSDVATIEDVKGFKTPVYKLKRALMKAVHGIDVLET